VNKREGNVEWFVLLVVVSSVFFPTIPLGIDFRLDDLLTLLIIPLLFAVKPKLRSSRLNYTYLFILFSVSLSILYGYTVLKVPPTIRDFNEFIRIIKPFLIILVVDYCNPQFLAKLLDKFFKVGAVALILFGLLEYFNLFGFRNILSEIYATTDRFSDFDRSRIVLTTGDPNVSAALLLFFLTYLTQSLFLKKGVFTNLVLLFFLLVVLLMTSSRTLLIIFALIMLVSLMYHGRRKKILSIVIGGVSVLTIAILIQFFDYLTIGFSTFKSGDNTSMMIRYLLWKEAFDLFLQSPILGWGPAKSIHTTIVDGEHFMLLRRYGLLGYGTIMSLFLGYAVVFIKKIKTIFEIGGNIQVLGFTSALLCIMIVVIMITNNFFSGYQLMPLFIIMITLVEKELKQNI
jgi:O-antigen ligase